MPNLEEIIAAVVGRASLDPQVMGANLGMAVKRAVPSANLKEYGGLRRFIQQHCTDKVRWVGKHGLDDVYAAITGALSPEEAQPTPAPNAWRALTNPTSSFSAFANPKDGALKVLPNQEEPPLGLVLIPKITPQEHRAIAQAFLSKLAPADRGTFEEALSSENYWHRWVRQTNTLEGGKYRSGWIIFRRDQILELLKAKMLAAGIDAPVAELVLQKAQDSKETNPLATGAPLFTRHDGRTRPSLPASRRFRQDDLRRLAHQAIDLMGEDEIRKLRLPLGAVIDALRTRQL
jgi:hypothetical protein